MSDTYDRARTEDESQDSVTVTRDYPSSTPARLFAYWTEPALITRWWPQEAEIDAREGGAYHLSWPSMGWHLRGRYTAVEPGALLAFTWRWDSDSADDPERHIRVVFTPLDAGKGTRLSVTHGTYGDSAREREARQGHLEGWTHFLAKLEELDPT